MIVKKQQLRIDSGRERDSSSSDYIANQIVNQRIGILSCMDLEIKACAIYVPGGHSA